MNFNSPYNVDLSEIDSCSNITEPENEVLLCIYQKVTESPLFKNLFLDTFLENQNLNVVFKVVDQLPPGHENSNETVRPTVKRVTNTGEFVLLDVEIKVKRSHIQSDSGMGIALTVIHESIHAYLHAIRYAAD